MSNDGDFNFSLIGGETIPFVGYVSARDKTAVSAAAMIRGSKNVYKKLSGTIANRPGQKRRGAADATIAGVDSSYEWGTSLASTRVLRVSNSKLQVESDIVTSGTYVWYDLQTSLTLSRFVFDTIWDNTLKKDFMSFVRGDTNLFRWDGGIEKIVSTTMNTIVLNSDAVQAGFRTSGGTVLVNGSTYTYAGITGNTLTGVVGDPSGEAANSVVLEKPITSATTPASTFTNDFIRTIGNRLHVGSYTSRLVYISSNSNYADYSVPSPRTPGTPELLTLDNTGKGIGVRQGNAHIFAGTSDLYVVNYQQITVGAVLTEQTTVDKQPTSNLEAALAHEFIDTVGDTLVYLDQLNQLRTYGTFRNITTPQYPTLSLALQDELQEINFTGGHLKSVGDTIYLTAPISGRAYLHRTRTVLDIAGNITSERFFDPPFIWNVSRIAVINGVEYGHSNANPQLYQLWNTAQWHDDSPSDEPLPYDSVMRMAYRNAGKDRSKKLKFDTVHYEGYMTTGSVVYGPVYMDYQGATSYQVPIINSNDSLATFYSGSMAPSLGDSSLGDNPLGDGLTIESNDQELLPKFRVETQVTENSCFEFALEVLSIDVDSRWEILDLGPNLTISDEKNAELTR